MASAIYVGRVGALAVALGVGVAVALGGSGVAWADDGAGDTGSSGSDTTSGSTDTDAGADTDTDTDNDPDTDTDTDADESDPEESDPAEESDAVDEEVDEPEPPSATDQQPSDESDDSEPEPSDRPSRPTPVDIEPAVDVAVREPVRDDVVAETVEVQDSPVDDVETVAVVQEPAGLVSVRLQSAARAVQPAAIAPPAPIQGPVTRIVSTLLAAIGIAPGSAGTPVPPAAPQLIVGVLALIRNEIEHFFFNKPPRFAQDEITLDVDSTDPQLLDIRAIDPDGDRITYRVPQRGDVGGPTHGTVTVDNATGAITYTADDGYEGTDSFVVSATDANDGLHFHGLLSLFRPFSAHTDSVVVSVNVDTLNDAPVAEDDSYAVAEDGTLTGSGLLDNDTDDGDLTVVSESKTTEKGGAVTLADDGSFTYKPAENFNGTDTFAYTVTDSAGLTDTATVTVTVTPVNDAPVAGDDRYTVTGHELKVSGPGLLANDTDVDGDALTVVPGNITSENGGSVILRSDGSFEYRPAAGNTLGQDSFTYTVRDAAGLEDTATVNLDIFDTVPIAVADDFRTNEDTALTATVLANDIDPSGGTLTVVSGTVTTAQGRTVTITQTGVFTYTPAANFNGVDTFYYTVRDADGDSATTMVRITVVAVNDAPVAVDDVVRVNRGQDITDSLLANDSDPDGDTITAVPQTVTTSMGGTAVIASDGTLTYTPPRTDGIDSFSYTIVDAQGATATARVSLIVTTPNAAPVARDDAYTVSEDSSLLGNVLNNDFDPDGDQMTTTAGTYRTTQGGSITFGNYGTISYAPAADFNGTDAYTYTVTDSHGASDTGLITFTVTPVNNDDNEIAQVITVGHGGATDLAFNADGSRAYVANADGTVSVIDTETGAVVGNAAVVPAGQTARSIAVDGNRLWVASSNSSGAGTLSAYTISTWAPVDINPGAGSSLAISGTPDEIVIGGGKVYVATTTATTEGLVTIFDASTFAVTGSTVPIGEPTNIAVTDSGHLYIADSVVDDPRAPAGFTAFEVYRVTDLGQNRGYLTPAPVGDVAMTTLADGTDRGLLVAADGTTVYVVRVNDLTAGFTVVSGTFDAVAVAVTDERGYVANGDGTVVVIDLATNQRVTTVDLPAGVTPTQVDVNPNGTQAYVTGSDGTVYVVNVGDAEAAIEV